MTDTLRTRRISLQLHPNAKKEQTLLKDFVMAKAPAASSKEGEAKYHREVVVKKLNGVNWDAFVASLYRKDKNTVISGSY